MRRPLFSQVKLGTRVTEKSVPHTKSNDPSGRA
jgi:hypothetical protein